MERSESRGIRPTRLSESIFSAFYPATGIGKHPPGRALTLAAKDGRFGEEAWRIRKGGSRFWASVTITALRNPDGKVEGFLEITP